MTALATAFVDVRADGRKIPADVSTALKSPAIGAAADTTGRSMGGRLSNAFKGAVTGLGGALALGLGGAAAIDFFKGAISGASDLNETLNLNRVIFKQNADEIVRWSRSSDSAFGLSQQSALAATGQFGDMFNQLGFGREQAQRMSTGVVELAADLGSFKNLGTEDVLERIAAGFRGEYDSLQQLVPAINAARVEQEALKQTGKAAADELTAQEKAAATLAVILNDTKSAQGDFARTSDSLANQTKILSAEWTNAKTALGQELLPAAVATVGFLKDTALPAMVDFAGFVKSDLIPPLQAGAGALADIGRAAGELPDPVKDAGLAIGAAVLATRGLSRLGETQWARNFSSAIETARIETMYATDAIRNAQGPTAKLGTIAAGTARGGLSALKVAGTGLVSVLGGPWGVALAGAGVALTLFASQHQKVQEEQARLAAHAQAVADAINQQTGAITRNAQQVARKELADSGAFDAAEKLGISLSEVTRAALGNERAYSHVIGRAKQLADENLQVGGSTNEIVDASALLQKTLASSTAAIDEERESIRQRREAAAGMAREMADQGRTYEEFNAGQRRMSGVLEDGQRAFKGQEDAVKGTREELEGYRRVVVTLISRQLGLSQALIDARKAMKENEDGFNKQTQAGVDNWQVLLDLASATEGFTTKTEKGRKAIADAREGIIEYADAQGKSRNEAIELAERLLGVAAAGKRIDEQPATLDVRADTDEANRKVREFAEGTKRSLAGIRDEPVKVTLSAQASKIMNQLGGLGVYAGGGSVFGPGTGTSDSVPALLSNGEHVWTAEEVRRAGGHDVVEALRRLALTGGFRKGDISAFADGGAVLRAQISGGGYFQAADEIERAFGRIVARVSSKVSNAVNRLFTELPVAGAVGHGGRMTPAQLMRGQEFARGEVGKPYIWGGVGPAGYDCSGFISAVTNAALGRNPYQRLGSTASMPWPGWGAGSGAFTVGWSTNVGGTGIGHTAGNIGGLNVESYGGHGPAVGSGARSPLDEMFSRIMHYDNGGTLFPGVTLAVNRTGRNERVRTAEEEERLREERREAREAQRELNRAISELARMIRHFNIRPGDSARDTRQMVNELAAELASVVGRSSPLVRALGGLGDRLVETQRQQDRAANQFAAASDRLESIRDAARAFGSGVGGNFANDLFGTGLSGALLQGRADRNDARRFLRLARRARRLGLSGAALRAVLASGDVQFLEELDTRREVRTFEDVFSSRRRAQQALSRMAQNAIFGDDIREARQERRQLRRTLDKLAARLERLEGATERGAYRGTRDGNKDRDRAAAARRRGA